MFSAGTVLQAQDTAGAGKPATDDQIRFFESKIRPLLATHCYECHGPDTQENDLRLDSLEGLLTGGKAGPSLVAGKPQSSLIVTAVGYRDNELRMPPEEKLSDQQIKDLTHWVAMGAPHPDAGKIRIDHSQVKVDLAAGRKHWAFQPPVKPAVPRNRNGSNANSIDAFILAKLQQHDLKPLGRADKRTLIRRSTFDLTGLPPTPDEINSFLNDDSPDAFTRVIDRLLDSPHYGERWGRHWLDVARYADSNGLDENAAHGNAWRYRDYVIRSFNEDKPYDEFLIEQLAGDLLESSSDVQLKHQRLVATGYLVLGPKVLAEVDERKMEMDIVDEQIDTIGRGLMGLTLGCARCHDHKFDPLAHTDYYALAGIFKSTRTMESFTKVARWNEVSIPSPEDVARQAAHERLMADKQRQIADEIAVAKGALESSSEAKTAQDLEQLFPETTQAQLKQLRAELKQLQESAPVMPMAMAVTDGTIADTSIHVRGSHLTLGARIPRRFPLVLAGTDQPRLPQDRSGRLEFARWLVEPDHPLTSRVMVNRIWRWHFGRGIVPTVDNFGLQGERPTHPQLLDWLAVRFVEEGWSVKTLHRLIMTSETYQRRSSKQSTGPADAVAARTDQPSPQTIDPGNQYYWRFHVRRLEAEALRDAMLAVSGSLDRTLGGRLLETPNRQLVFNHTSEDSSNYDTRRRSIYVPVIRNHLYDMFQLFDYSDASVLIGSRNTSVVAPQALFLMNSEFVTEITTVMAKRLLATPASPQQRIERLFEEAYGRLPTEAESKRVLEFLKQFQNPENLHEPERAWQRLCQSILSSSEFAYVR